MRSRRVYTDYLADILHAAERAEQFLAGMDLAALKADEKTAFAVVRALEIIGEAAKSIPQIIRDRHTGIPWRDLAGMRDKLTHH